VRYTVRLTAGARDDLQRLEDFLVERAIESGDFDLPGRAMDAIRHELRILHTNPFTCRIAEDNPFERELVIPFGSSGYVALFQVVHEREIWVTAVRHQREEDYY
jgi:hypothetical protein